MAQRTDSFDLGRLGLHSGEGRRIDTRVAFDPLELGAQTYSIEGGDVPVRLEASRTTGGYALRLRCALRVEGPCMRCLEDAGRDVEVDAREVDQPGADDEDLRSPYLEGDELDLRAWGRDALVLALALPAQIVCREDCLGLCAICGENLNDTGREHRHESTPDPRWAKLGELRFE